MTSLLEAPIFKATLDDFLQQAEVAFRRRASAAGLQLTGEMLSSFQAKASTIGENFIKGHVEMVGYVRLKDMKRLHHTHVRPADMLENFIDKIGPENFAYIPGYEYIGATLPDRNAQINRIKFGIQAYDRKHPDKRRAYKGIYNDPLGRQIFGRLHRRIAELATQTATEQTIEFLEKQ